jgi:8-oxo-dGTP pyrophosphatase MutT (NUDIX family)
VNDVPTQNALSAGGVAFRTLEGQIQVVLISVGEPVRWQLPKGTVDEDETIEAAALREVQEETGVSAELIGLIDVIEYWFYGMRGGRRVRFHKFVHFFLMRYISGDVTRHDHEVNEARWFEIDEAQKILAFDTERELVNQAKQMITDQELT